MGKTSLERLLELKTTRQSGELPCKPECNYNLNCGKDFPLRPPCNSVISGVAHRLRQATNVSGVKIEAKGTAVHMTGFIPYGREENKKDMPIPGTTRVINKGNIFKP